MVGRFHSEVTVNIQALVQDSDDVDSAVIGLSVEHHVGAGGKLAVAGTHLLA